MAANQKIDPAQLRFKTLTPQTWDDFTDLFGKNGAYSGCWCMWWRMPRKQFEANQGENNKQSMKQIVDSGEIPGIMAYYGDVPVGWCSVAPRENFASLERSRVLQRLDDKAVWSIVCFFIRKGFKGNNISLHLIRAALDYAASQGAKIVEAYPTAVREKKLHVVSSFMGLPKIFEQAGFKTCKQASEAKLIMRYYF